MLSGKKKKKKKNPSANAGDTGSSLVSSGKTPHIVEQISPCIATTEAGAPRACVLQPEEPPK